MGSLTVCRLPVSTFHKGRRAWVMLLHEISVQSGSQSAHQPLSCAQLADADIEAHSEDL